MAAQPKSENLVLSAFFNARDSETRVTARETHRCDICGEHHEGDAHYAPDVMGYPTLVVFTTACEVN